MAFNFPATPADGDTVIQGGITYYYSAARGVWTADINDRFTPSTGLELIDTTYNTLSSTQIDANVLNTDQTIVSRTLTVGDLVVGTDGEPSSGSGGVISSDGEFTVGDTGEYVWWDGTKLEIRGEITNFTPGGVAGTSGTWTAVNTNETLSDNTWTEPGVFRVYMTGGGGGGSFSRGGTSINNANTNSCGGGGGGSTIFTVDYDGNSTVVFTPGTGGAGATRPANNTGRAAGSSGNASTFAIGGTTVATANGGQGGQSNTAGNGGNATTNSAVNAAVIGVGGVGSVTAGGGGGGSDALLAVNNTVGNIVPATNNTYVDASGTVSGAPGRTISSNSTIYELVVNTLSGQTRVQVINGNSAVSGNTGNVFGGGGGLSAGPANNANTNILCTGGSGGVGAGGGAVSAGGERVDSNSVAGSGGGGTLYWMRF